MVFCGVGLLLISTFLHSVSLQTRFKQAGNLRGRSKADIFRAVGNPQAVNYQPDGSSIVQWRQELPIGIYHIVLLFDRNDLCVRITEEHSTMR